MKMSENRIKIVEKILNANDRLAKANRQKFDDAGVYAINFDGVPRRWQDQLYHQNY